MSHGGMADNGQVHYSHNLDISDSKCRPVATQD